jgi:hypothetical protein
MRTEGPRTGDITSIAAYLNYSTDNFNSEYTNLPIFPGGQSLQPSGRRVVRRITFSVFSALSQLHRQNMRHADRIPAITPVNLRQNLTTDTVIRPSIVGEKSIVDARATKMLALNVSKSGCLPDKGFPARQFESSENCR